MQPGDVVEITVEGVGSSQEPGSERITQLRSKRLGFTAHPRYPTKSDMSSLRYYPIVVVGASAALLGYAILSRKSKKSPEQMEYERRTELTHGGRIIDGNIIDVHRIGRR